MPPFGTFADTKALFYKVAKLYKERGKIVQQKPQNRIDRIEN